MRRLIRVIALLSALIGMLSACQGREGAEKETDPLVSVPTVVMEYREVSETAGDTVLYRASIHEPRLLLPQAYRVQQQEIEEMLSSYVEKLLACPVDLDSLRSRAESSPAIFVPYERIVTTTETFCAGTMVSLLFSIETRGGGLGSRYETAGLTLHAYLGKKMDLPSLLFLTEEETCRLYLAAFAEDMQANPQYYDDPNADIPIEWVDLTGFCLTGEGVMLWMPFGTVSPGASPILTLTPEDLVRLVGKGSMLHLPGESQPADTVAAG